MNAKEMFEELGYEVSPLIGFIMIRRKKKERPTSEFDYGREIWFDREKKTVKIYGEDSFELHLAIHQQMKELGWIE